MEEVALRGARRPQPHAGKGSCRRKGFGAIACFYVFPVGGDLVQARPAEEVPLLAQVEAVGELHARNLPMRRAIPQALEIDADERAQEKGIGRAVEEAFVYIHVHEALGAVAAGRAHEIAVIEVRVFPEIRRLQRQQMTRGIEEDLLELQMRRAGALGEMSSCPPG